MNSANVLARKDPSTILQCRMPSSSDIAGSTEKLGGYKERLDKIV